MIIQNFKPFVGQHCETTTTGCLLNQIDLEYSEPMLFGLGEGLGFLLWNMKTMDFPFIGGRVKTDLLTENICRNLNLKLDVKETTSVQKAWRNIVAPLSIGKAVGLKLDCFHLEYFTSKIHFAGHYAAMYGYDDTFAYLVDTYQQGGEVKTSLENLKLARNERGPMSSRNKSFTIERVAELPDIKQAVKKAIFRNAVDYLNPPIKNLGYKGIIKTSSEIKKWYSTSKNIKTEFQTSSMLMERAGTGGALFRNLYRDFLYESIHKLGIEELNDGYQEFKEIAKLWTEVSNLFFQVGETKNMKYLDQASDVLLDLCKREKQAMENLKEVCT